MQNNIISKDLASITKADSKVGFYTLIKVGDKIFGFDSRTVLEIVKIAQLDYPSRMLSCILGIARYEGEPVSVIDLREVFKEKRVVYGLSARMLILKDDDTKIAVVCDEVLDVKKIKKERIHNIEYQKDGKIYEGMYSNDDMAIYIISAKGLVEYISENRDKYSTSSDKNYVVNDEKSLPVLMERKQILNQVSSDIQNSISLYDSGVTFSINDVKYYINMASVKEFYKLKNSKFIKVPCTKDYILGLINIKGDYITVLDIRRLYNNTRTEIKEKSTIIILNSQEFKIGILADEIEESMNIDFDEIIQNKLQKGDENIMSEFVSGGEIYQVLDIEQLLKDERLTIC